MGTVEMTNRKEGFKLQGDRTSIEDALVARFRFAREMKGRKAAATRQFWSLHQGTKTLSRVLNPKINSPYFAREISIGIHCAFRARNGEDEIFIAENSILKISKTSFLIFDILDK